MDRAPHAAAEAPPLARLGSDVAQRMIDLDAYLREPLASPAVALSPLVCTFLDATDVQSFRAQILRAR